MLTRAELVDTLQEHASKYWDALAKVHPKLKRIPTPAVELNSRLTRTAGRAWNDYSLIELGTKFFARHHFEMVEQILAHEICHCADAALTGNEFDNSDTAHGKMWADLMRSLGREPLQYHSMDLRA